jgi:hypothetical protein
MQQDDKGPRELAEELGGSIDWAARLPDGSGAATMTLPLPKDHWLTRQGQNVPPMEFRMGTNFVAEIMIAERGWGGRRKRYDRKQLEEVFAKAGRYAVRCATMNGQEDDYDPDALVGNLVIALLGYCTADALSSDIWTNPGPEGDAERQRLAEESHDPNWLADSLERR